MGIEPGSSFSKLSVARLLRFQCTNTEFIQTVHNDDAKEIWYHWKFTVYDCLFSINVLIFLCFLIITCGKLTKIITISIYIAQVTWIYDHLRINLRPISNHHDQISWHGQWRIYYNYGILWAPFNYSILWAPFTCSLIDCLTFADNRLYLDLSGIILVCLDSTQVSLYMI